MRVGIYTPYLDSFGGGERYMLTIAEILSSQECPQNQVDLLLDKHHLTLNPEKLKEDLSSRLNLDLSRVDLVPAPLGKGAGFLDRFFFLKKYDVFFYLTDGSIFYSTARKNIIHFQVPFKNNGGQGLWGSFKLSSWGLAICNSRFTEEVIKKEWPIKSRVIYPPVSIEDIKPLKKKKQILSVGRFNSFLKSKKHEEMIKVFTEMYKSGKVKEWSLHLVGSVEGDPSYVEQLKEMTEGAPINFYPNLPYKELIKLYGESSIYWHAAGFGETDPAKMEHFGITTVEAMAGGCVPVVINKGGQPEVAQDQKSGLLWDSLEALQELTLKLINDPKKMSELSKGAVSKSQIFSKTHFAEEINAIIKSS